MASPRSAIDYRRLRRSAAATGIADGITAVALPLLAAGQTNDPVAIAGVMAVQHLPWIIAEQASRGLRSFGDRRTIVGMANTIRALVAVLLGGLAVSNKESLMFVYLGALVIGIGEAVIDEAEDETLDILLDSSEITDARATVRSRGMTGLALLGLPLGGLLYGAASPAPFILSMVAYAVGALFALGVKTTISPKAAPVTSSPAQRAVPHLARPVILVAALASGATSGCLGVFVLYATDTLGLGALHYGAVLAIFLLGSYLGAMCAPWVGETIGIANGIASALVITGLGYVLTSLFAGQSVERAIPALTLSSTGAMCAGVLLRVMLQTTFMSSSKPVSKEALHVLHLATWSAIALGAVLGGVIVKASGFPTMFLLMAGLLAIGAALGATLQTGPSEPSKRRASQTNPSSGQIIR